MFRAEVIIIGAGSVGLLLANLLGQRGVRVLILDRKSQVEPSSKAIGISPTTLEILSGLGLAERFNGEGRQVRDVEVFGNQGRLGSLNFQGIESPFQHILTDSFYLF